MPNLILTLSHWCLCADTLWLISPWPAPLRTPMTPSASAILLFGHPVTFQIPAQFWCPTPSVWHCRSPVRQPRTSLLVQMGKTLIWPLAMYVKKMHHDMILKLDVFLFSFTFPSPSWIFGGKLQLLYLSLVSLQQSSRSTFKSWPGIVAPNPAWWFCSAHFQPVPVWWAHRFWPGREQAVWLNFSFFLFLVSVNKCALLTGLT